MNWFIKSLACALCALTLPACGSKVLVGTMNSEEGGGGEAGNPAPTASTGMDGCSADPWAPVVCTVDADCDALGAVCNAGACSCSSDPRHYAIVWGSDPLTMVLANWPLSCALPHEVDIVLPHPNCMTYSLHIELPPALLKPGPVVRNKGGFPSTWSLPRDGGPPTCPVNANANTNLDVFVDALDILSVDGKNLTVNVDFQTPDPLLAQYMGGTYIAERCAP